MRQHTNIKDININRQAETACSIVLALIIGFALAAAIVTWWS